MLIANVNAKVLRCHYCYSRIGTGIRDTDSQSQWVVQRGQSAWWHSKCCGTVVLLVLIWMGRRTQRRRGRKIPQLPYKISQFCELLSMLSVYVTECRHISHRNSQWSLWKKETCSWCESGELENKVHFTLHCSLWRFKNCALQKNVLPRCRFLSARMIRKTFEGELFFLLW